MLITLSENTFLFFDNTFYARLADRTDYTQPSFWCHLDKKRGSHCDQIVEH